MALRDYLPDWIQEFYRSRKNRRKILKKFGEKAFLDPKNLKFPIVNPRTGKIECGLLLAAYVRAKQWKYKKIAKKAAKLYKEHGCEEKLYDIKEV